MNKERIYNFCAGPSNLPLEVIDEISHNLYSYRSSGMGIMEISHRGKLFEDLILETESKIKSLYGLADDYSVLFLTGGATNQFSMVPLNLISDSRIKDPKIIAGYFESGHWANLAFNEATKINPKHSEGIHLLASSKGNGYKNLPYFNSDLSTVKTEDLKLLSYIHITTNNTVIGSQYQTLPTDILLENGVELPDIVLDASSDILSKPIDFNKQKISLLYAGAQKNLGIAGLTILIIKKELLIEDQPHLPILLNYKTHINAGSIYNTPPVFPIYVTNLMAKWVEKMGGLNYFKNHNQDKANIIYNYLDGNSYYKPYVDKDSRSLMNITFNINCDDGDKRSLLEEKFIKEAKRGGFFELKGHRIVGGIRASIYNAFPVEGIKKLVEFMDQFKSENPLQ